MKSAIRNSAASDQVVGHALRPIFEPRSVVIVGSSTNPRKRGYQAVRALLDAGYSGRIYPVNPSGGEVLGLPVASSLEDLQEVPDLALICTPAGSVPEILEGCAAKGIPGAIILAVGFREAGSDGAALERRVVEVAERTGIRVVGPNTSGVLNAATGLNLVGVRDVPPGHLAILAQSGNVGLALMEQASRHSQGVSVYVGVGNETDIGFHEYLDFLGEDSDTSAVLMYVEGFQDGHRFMEVARRLSRTKPIVLLKGGRSETGVAAARSHTGAIAGSTAVLRAAAAQAGIQLVERSDELLPVGEMLTNQPPARDCCGIVVLSDGGGYATLAADSLTERGVQLAKLGGDTQARLRELLGPAASVDNPVDVAGAADQDPEVFSRALEAILADPATGGVAMVGLFGGYSIRFAEELASAECSAATAIANLASGAGVPLVVQSLYEAQSTGPIKRLRSCGVPVVGSIELAAQCISASYHRGLYLRADKRDPAGYSAKRPVEAECIHTARTEDRTVLTETETRCLVEEYHVPVAPALLCTTADEVATAQREFNVPVAIKVVSPSVIHKTDAGGVVLSVSTPEEAVSAFERVTLAAREYAEGLELPPDIRGVLVAPMLEPPVAELIVGAKRDPQFGPVVTVGAGGLAVELLEDAALRVLPIDRIEALAMLRELRIAPIIDGFRGRPAASVESLAQIVLGIGECIMANPQIAAIEVNPVFAYPDRAIAVDARGLLHDIDRRTSS